MNHTLTALVLFAMNPIQFGRSDLESAYRLQPLVGSAVSFRVWEADPDVDGVLDLLRRWHGVIGVRFHACIFALSQGIPTIGADLYPGRGGKVISFGTWDGTTTRGSWTRSPPRGSRQDWISPCGPLADMPLGGFRFRTPPGADGRTGLTTRDKSLNL